MRVAVSGATGFVGGYLLPVLAQKHSVVALTRGELPTAVLPGITWRTEAACSPAPPMLPPGTDALIHLAAVLPSPQCPPEAFWFNVQSTFRLMHALRQAGGRRLVLASTQMVYGTPQGLPIKETAVCNPQTDYGVSKLAAEALLRQQGPRLGLEVICLRLAEIYGFGQQRGYVCDRFVARALAGDNILLFSNFRQMRDLLYVRDAARAFILALESQVQGVFNIGAGRSSSLEDYATACVDILGQGRCKLDYAPEQPNLGNAPPDFWMDFSLAQTQLGFQAQYDLPAAMADILTLAQGRQTG